MTTPIRFDVDKDYILHRTDLGLDPIRVNYRGRPSYGQAAVYLKYDGGGSCVVPEEFLHDAQGPGTYYTPRDVYEAATGANGFLSSDEITA